MKSKPLEIAIAGTQHSLLLPEEFVKPFLDRNIKRVKVKASFEDKELDFHGAIQKRGTSYYMIFGKRYQKILGIFPNDYFIVQLFEDNSKYGVAMPAELDAVFFSDHEAFEIFDSFTAGKKRGLIYGIASYKQEQTRIDKSLLLCDNLKSGIRDNRKLLKSF